MWLELTIQINNVYAKTSAAFQSSRKNLISVETNEDTNTYMA